MHQTVINHRFPLKLWTKNEDFPAEYAKFPGCSTADSDFGMTKRRHGDENAIIGSALKKCIDMLINFLLKFDANSSPNVRKTISAGRRQSDDNDGES